MFERLIKKSRSLPRPGALFFSALALITVAFAGCAPPSAAPPQRASGDAAPERPERPERLERPERAQRSQRPENLPLAILPDGITVNLELAITPEEISRGLMFRPALPENRGMLFLFETAEKHFWMKNTYVALDIIFLDGSGRVLAISEDAQPCKAEPCPRYPSGQPVTAALELVAGAASRHGVVEGATIDFQNVANYPLTPPTQEEDPARDEGL